MCHPSKQTVLSWKQLKPNELKKFFYLLPLTCLKRFRKKTLLQEGNISIFTLATHELSVADWEDPSKNLSARCTFVSHCFSVALQEFVYKNVCSFSSCCQSLTSSSSLRDVHAPVNSCAYVLKFYFLLLTCCMLCELFEEPEN